MLRVLLICIRAYTKIQKVLSHNFTLITTLKNIQYALNRLPSLVIYLIRRASGMS